MIHFRVITKPDRWSLALVSDSIIDQVVGQRQSHACSTIVVTTGNKDAYLRINEILQSNEHGLFNKFLSHITQRSSINDVMSMIFFHLAL